MAKSKDYYTDPAQSAASVSSALAIIAVILIRQYKRLRERFGAKFVVRSGYPPRFSVAIHPRNAWIVELGNIVLQPRVLAGAVAAAGIFAGSFWLTLLFL
jgi:hypothetical protein